MGALPSSASFKVYWPWFLGNLALPLNDFVVQQCFTDDGIDIDATSESTSENAAEIGLGLGVYPKSKLLHSSPRAMLTELV